MQKMGRIKYLRLQGVVICHILEEKLERQRGRGHMKGSKVKKTMDIDLESNSTCEMNTKMQFQPKLEYMVI